jgi:translation initiation factor 2 subunit 2
MTSNYHELLARAHSQLPHDILAHARFEIPRVKSGTIGMRTYIVNYKEIADALRRDPLHLLRYLSREMATAGSLDAARAIFQGKFKSDTLESLIQHYAQDFVVCPVCKRPDTKIVKEKRFYFMVCEACGAKSSVKAV